MICIDSEPGYILLSKLKYHYIFAHNYPMKISYQNNVLAEITAHVLIESHRYQQKSHLAPNEPYSLGQNT